MSRLLILALSVLLLFCSLPNNSESSINLNGTNGWFNCGNDSSFFVDTPLTIAISFNWKSGNVRHFQTLFAIGDDTNDRWKIQWDNANVFLKVFDDINNGGTSIASSTNVTSGFHTIVVTIHGTNGTDIYIDGVSDGSNAGRKLGFNDLPSGTSTVIIGNGMAGDGTIPENDRQWEGYIYEVAISNSIWSQQMINNFHNSNVRRVSVQDASIIEYWTLDDYPGGKTLVSINTYIGQIANTVCTPTPDSQTFASSDDVLSYPY